MNKDDLRKYIDGLDDDTEIIVITSKEQLSVIPKYCQRVDTPTTTNWVFRVFLNGAWKVAVVWSVLISLFPGMPKPSDLYITSKDSIRLAIENIDFSFPYKENEKKTPYFGFEGITAGTSVWTPVSGVKPIVFGKLFPDENV